METPSYKAVMRVLMTRGTWVDRTELASCSTCVPALEDALADMVLNGKAEYRVGVGYRLKHSVLVRRAVRELVNRADLKKSVKLIQKPDGVHLGIAQRTGPDVLDMAMAAMVVPLPKGVDGVEHAMRVFMSLK